MVTKAGVHDSEPLFLLPFDEVPAISLTDEINDVVGASEGAGGNETKKRYGTSEVLRLGNGPLENGAGVSEGCNKFVLNAGNFVMLRPTENAHRPSIGKVVYFWEGKRDGKTVGPYVRVQWCYRAEDLGEMPSETFGEDEVFETEHYDDIGVEVIAGRCAVTSYNEWLSMMLVSRVNGLGRNKAEENGQDNDQEEASGQGEQHVGDVGPHDDMSDTQSSFGDNYTSAAVRYYCRKFYDPVSQAFTASTFEDKDSNPARQLGFRSRGDCTTRQSDSDESASIGDDFAPSDDDLEDHAERQTGTKRRRTGRRDTNSDRRSSGRPERAALFSLPGDIGAPETLPCRDEEKKQVRQFLTDAITQSAEGIHGGSRCLYICGVPGTGKTATVREILRDLAKLRAAGELPPFEAVEANAMSLPDPNLVYSELYRAITGYEGFSPSHAAQLLEKRFSDASLATGKATKHGMDRRTAREKGKCVVLILDEMDVLVSRKQKVLYDVLEWPTRKNARMAVIGISNTLDLPERMLPRLGSRLGVNRVTYPPYSSDQLKVILNMKLEHMKDVQYNSSAVTLCATKVGAVSGDVRRALEILRRAAEIFNTEGSKAKDAVAATHVHMAIQDISGRSRLLTLSQLSIIERLFLVSAVVLARNLGSFAIDETSSISAVTSKALDAARRNSKFFVDGVSPSVRDLEEACFRLVGQRLVLLEKTAVFKNSRVIVNVSGDDCSFALRECSLSQKLLTET